MKAGEKNYLKESNGTKANCNANVTQVRKSRIYILEALIPIRADEESKWKQSNRQNAGKCGDQDVIGFSFASDWLRGCHEFSGPITERNKAKPMQFQITLDIRLKFVLNGPIILK